MVKAKAVRRLVKKTLKLRPTLMYVTGLIQMLAHTALLFGAGWALLAGSSWALIGVTYAFALTSLLLNGPAVAAALQEQPFARLTPLRFLALCALALLPLLPGGSLIMLASYVNREWVVIAQWALTHMAVFAAMVCAVSLVVLALALFIGVFTRQVAMYLLESDRVRLRAVSQACRNGLFYIYSPLKAFFGSFGWFLGMTALLLCGTLCAYWAQGFWIPGLGWMDQAMLLMAFVMNQSTWLVCAALVLTLVWIVGLGVYFWPRYLLKRVYIHRSIMRISGMMDAETK